MLRYVVNSLEKKKPNSNPDSNMQIILDPAGSESGSTTLLDIGKNYEKVGEKPEENVDKLKCRV
jgi:hypothetical protein